VKHQCNATLADGSRCNGGAKAGDVLCGPHADHDRAATDAVLVRLADTFGSRSDPVLVHELPYEPST
jgi:hypothetical protein